ncbi:MAG: hypothetical protein AAFR84_03140 [Pseudomonadota bacterium]
MFSVFGQKARAWWALWPTLLLASALSSAPAKADFGQQDWPCQQRKVLHLSWGQMWAGPPLPEDPAAWRDDAEIDRLSALLAARRTSMAEAETLVAAVDAGVERAREERLVALFAGSFALIDRERARIVEGIERLSRRERARTDRIDALRAEITGLRETTPETDFDGLDRIEELEDTLAWETRIYEDRRRSLQFVCESPVILEKRAFSLARLIQEKL